MKTANILYIALLGIILFSGPGLAEANTAPVTNGTIPDQTVTDLIATTVDVSTYFSDPEGDALTYTATSSDTAVATVSVSNSTISITAVAAGIGYDHGDGNGSRRVKCGPNALCECEPLPCHSGYNPRPNVRCAWWECHSGRK